MLVDAVQDDITNAYMFKEKLGGYKDGHYTGGSSKSLVELAEQSADNQKKRAHAYASLNEKSVSNNNEFVVDKNATHREDKIRDDITGCVKSKEKQQLCTPTLSQNKHETRVAKKRDVASKAFNETKRRAICEYNNYTIIEDEISQTSNGMSKRFIVMKKEYNDTDYEVHIANSPLCGCPYFKDNKGKQICKHIIMVILSLGVDENDPLLYQIGYTESELSSLIDSKIIKFKRNSHHDDAQPRFKHRFYLTVYCKGSQRGRRPKCVGCEQPLDDGVIVEIDGKYKYQTHSRDHTFRYHAKDGCIRYIPKNSNIKSLPSEIYRGGLTTEQILEAKQQLKMRIL